MTSAAATAPDKGQLARPAQPRQGRLSPQAAGAPPRIGSGAVLRWLARGPPGRGRPIRRARGRQPGQRRQSPSQLPFRVFPGAALPGPRARTRARRRARHVALRTRARGPGRALRGASEERSCGRPARLCRRRGPFPTPAGACARGLTEDDDARGSVANLLVLRAGQLQHALGRRVRHVDLAEDGVAIVRDDNAAHGVQEHLQHGARAKGRADDVRHGLRVGGGRRDEGSRARGGGASPAAKPRFERSFSLLRRSSAPAPASPCRPPRSAAAPCAQFRASCSG